MFFKPELIIYVWMIPAFIFFILPLLFLPIFLVTKKASAESISYNAKNAAVYPGSAIGEKRAFPRQAHEGIYAHVSDGINCCRVAVNNISKNGINFACPQDMLSRDADKLGVLLTGSGMSFPLQVKPTWKDFQGDEQSIGATIVSTPPDMWEEFAGSIEGRYIAESRQPVQ
jgi:hypothetical protein